MADKIVKARIITVAFLFMLTSCISHTMKSVSFLGDEVPYHADPQNKDVLLYQNPNRRVVSYSKFLIDPVKIYSNDLHGIDPKDQALLAETFRKDLIGILGGLPIVDKGGPGILRIRVAIQDIQPAHIELDEDKMIVLRLDTLLSRVAMELECVDSVTGERVAALIHTLDDRRYFEKEKTTRFVNIQEAFNLWTKSLRKRFDAARAKPEKGFDNSDLDWQQEERRRHFEEGE
jgi:hypothetical protein